MEPDQWLPDEIRRRRCVLVALGSWRQSQQAESFGLIEEEFPDFPIVGNRRVAF